jgi:hypothetical protein
MVGAEGDGGEQPRPAHPAAARRGPAVVVVCVALASLFGSGLWRATAGSGHHSPSAALEQASLLPAPGAAGLAAAPENTARLHYGDLAAVDWASVRYPMACAGGKVRVLATELADVTGDKAPDATVLARCATGTHQPTGVFVFGAAPATAGRKAPAPRLLATLLRPAAGVFGDHLAVTASEIRVTGFSYSSAGVPRCCPDQMVEKCWHWDGTRFTRVA